MPLTNNLPPEIMDKLVLEAALVFKDERDRWITSGPIHRPNGDPEDDVYQLYRREDCPLGPRLDTKTATEAIAYHQVTRRMIPDFKLLRCMEAAIRQIESAILRGGVANHPVKDHGDNSPSGPGNRG